MAEGSFVATVVPLLGELTEERAAAIVEFWTAHGALSEHEEVEERLGEVVCVLVDESDEIVGVNTAYGAEVAVIGGRPFWVYRSYLLPQAAEADSAMINAAFDSLEAVFDPAGGGPIGLCVLLADPDEIARRRELVWGDTGLMYAGYLDDERQLRIRYFDEAAIGPALPNSPTLAHTRETEYELEDRYRILPLEEAEGVSPEDVIAFWGRERAIPAGDDPNRRVHDVHLVALERDQRVVGVSSAYLQRNAQLRMDLLYYRAFVGREHRMGTLAGTLAVKGRELLQDRYVSGADVRAAGIVYEVENEGLKRYFNKALWLPTDFTFIGETERRAHVRVHYFPGGLAPEPSQ